MRSIAAIYIASLLIICVALAGCASPPGNCERGRIVCVQ